MAVSLHVVIDNTPNELLDRALLYLVRTNQRAVNIAAGSQIDRGMQFVERVRAALPNIDIFWRVLEDTGIHSKLSVDEWWRQRVAPLLSWMQKNRVIMVLDNESSGDNNAIRYYVQWEVEALKRLHAVGLRGAAARFATGNIGDGTNGNPNQYPLLKPLFDALLPGDWIAPNEYSNAPGKSSSGNIARFKLMETVAGRQLPISIGEAGVLDGYDPYRGYKTVMTDEQFVAQILGEEVWYRPDIDRSLFAISGDAAKWGTMQVSDLVMRLLEEHYAKNPIPRRSKVVDKLEKVQITINSAVRLRSAPSTSASIITTLSPAIIHAELFTQGGGPTVANGYTWQKVRIGTVDGWIASELVTIIPEVDVPDDSISIDKYIYDDAVSQMEAEILDLEAAKAQTIAEFDDTITKLRASITRLKEASKSL